MGCGGSKSVKTKNSVVPQASEGLTAQQIELVRDTWKDVKQDLEGHGVTFYTRLFTEHPETQQLFTFRDVEGIDKLKEDDRFKFQAKRVMEMVGAAVDGLDDVPSLAGVLKDLGARHVKWNVKEEHYGPVGEALVFTLQTGLTEKFTTEVKEAWLAVYGIVADNMKAGAREAQTSG
uniref:Globin-like protein n=1 Tax=Exaiptasia diaphana TaxID=2652724 RepID=A0A2K9UYR0_EXADI|nr:globin-like protein [Exaiptasia diaphana]